jgi:hypothetical protein
LKPYRFDGKLLICNSVPIMASLTHAASLRRQAATILKAFLIDQGMFARRERRGCTKQAKEK